jgi:predicted dehydrogenase
MAEKLTAIVHGSGYAGKGHAEALRDAGVDVIGMVSRTLEVVTAVASEMEIPFAGTDWKTALTELKPDIVAIGTPGGAHYDAVIAAIEAGCHIYCDKPLTSYANQSKDVFEKSQEAGIKTAFAASFCYQPHALLAQELVEKGAIGEPQEVEFISHYNLDPLIPFGWSHRIDLGGGRLSNNFTHKLSIALRVLGGKLLRINGETRNDMHVAPVVEGVHDFRERDKYAPDPKTDPSIKWETVDAEYSYTAMAKIQPSAEHRTDVSALFKHGGMQPRYQQADSVDFYGSDGAIHIDGAYAQGPLYLKERTGDWKRIEPSAQLLSSIPDIEDDTQRNWTQLAREFVADIQGEEYSGYQTFKDGWVFQEAIDAIRGAEGWIDMPS